MLINHLRGFLVALTIVMTFFLANANAIADTLKIATWNIENLRVGATKDFPALQEYSDRFCSRIIFKI